jgi:hypothetical protein
MVPKTRSWRELGFGSTPESVQIEPGPALFRRLPADDQRAILGPAKYRAYKAKDITLPDVVATRDSPVWGPSTSEAGLNAAKTNAAIRRQGGSGAAPAVPTPPPPPPPPPRALVSPGDITNTLRLDVSRREAQKAVASEVKEAMDVLDGLLRLPPSRNPGGKLPISYGYDIGTAKGRYQLSAYRERQEFMRSDISLADGADAGTMLHEFGHFIDGELFDRIEFTDTVTDDISHPLRAWWEAVRASDSLRGIANSTSLDDEFREYLLRTDEVWARSFAQWAALRSGRANVMDKVMRGGAQWSDSDFDAIARALDDIFRGRGWLA